VITGTLGSTPIENGKVRGEDVTFTAGGTTYALRLSGDALTGTTKGAAGGSAWRATRTK